ncbi:hypothetical protein FI667_g14963, partial [Globisporangium splendens]
MWRNSDLANNGGLSAVAATSTTSGSSNSSTTGTSSTARAPPSSSIDAMWSFDSTRATTTGAASTSSAGFARSGSENHGVIGSGNARLLWNRMAPEEEEREEEALPSYLSYLQPAFRPSAGDRLASFEDPIRRPPPNLSHPATSNTGTSSSSFAFGASTTATAATASSSAHYTYNASSRAYPMSTMMMNDPSTLQVESKSKEFAFALQDFILAQIEQQQQQQQPKSQPPGLMTPVGSPTNCNCEPLKLRVSELEQQLHALQGQVTSLIKSGMGNTSMAQGVIPHGVQPPLPGSSLPLGQPQPPLPPPQPSSQLPPGAGSAMSDRVSTLEGRQSAFQSQLAQISKVLGVPVGKHGKNSQVKTLVQTLREEIDLKVQASTAELEVKCVETVKEQLESVIAEIAKDEIQTQMRDVASSAASSSPSLSYETVLGALAEEHEASLTKLSTYFEERLIQESKQRVGLESRIQTRFGEHEEWLQQLEGEFGSWHDTSSSVAAQIRVIQNKIVEVEEKWKGDMLKWSKVSTESLNSPDSVSPTSNGNGAASSKMKNKAGPGASSSSPGVTGNGAPNGSGDAFSRTVHQLQVQFKHFQSEYKTDIAELRENLALMETWVKTTRQEGRDLAKNAKGMKQLVEKLVRDTGSAEELLQQYVSTITHQVASVTRQYVSVRIRDNNRLIDATLRARVPAYVENESESFMLVRPEKKEPDGDDKHGGSVHVSNGSGAAASGLSFVLREDDEEGIRKVLASQTQSTERSSSVSTSIASSSSSSSSPSHA